jgi:saccharopine dehydrogenase-like NADP-dependent oxidoreductase
VFRAVILGGYGHFGARIAAKLARDGICDVVVAGRDGAKARDVAAGLGTDWAAVDGNAPDLASRLSTLRADLVISTAGPFQGQDYRVARAALAAGAHYADIADGRAFVCGIASLDGEARACGRLAVSGASSVPALSSAVVDRYAPEFSRLDSIDIGISTTQRPQGLATTRAVLGYAGKTLPTWREGQAATATGWQGLRRRSFGAPVGSRWLCDCDVPELELFPRRYRGVRHVRFGAGVELALAQWGLWMLAGTVRMGLVRDLSAWVPALHASSRWLEPLAAGRSAMFVELHGADAQGRPHRRCWQLAAEQHDGAHIPAMAAVALTRRLARGDALEPGAMPCLGLVSLDQYLAELGGLRIAVQAA